MADFMEIDELTYESMTSHCFEDGSSFRAIYVVYDLGHEL